MQSISGGRCAVNFRIDHLSQHVLIGVALTGVELHEGSGKLSLMLKETGELTAWGNKLGVLPGFGVGDIIRFQVDHTSREVQIFRNGETKPGATVGGLPSAPLRPFACFGAINSSVTLVTLD